MAISSTEDEIRLAKIDAMGTDLGETHFLLWKDLTWLHFEWHEYKSLFAIDASRIDLMNHTAPRFFWSLERILWQDILLSISRLADPVATKGQQNLTFRRLRPLAAPAIVARLDSALDVFEASAAFARDWRHRRFAHRSLDHASDPTAEPLQEASRTSVDTALRNACEVMNLVDLHYTKSTTCYDIGGGSSGGVGHLLRFLDSGLEAEQLRRAKHESWRPRFK